MKYKYMFLIRNGKIEIYSLRHVHITGQEDMWVNRSVHKYFAFKENQVFDTVQQAHDAAVKYLEKKNYDPSLNEHVVMKKSQLKSLIKVILKEVIHEGGGVSDEYDLEDVEMDGIEIPNLTTKEYTLKVWIRIEYNADSGSPATGMFGPPEYSSPGEGESVEIINSQPVSLEILAPDDKKFVEVDINKLSPSQKLSLNNAVKSYVDDNESEISDQILNSLGKPDSWNEREYELDDER